MKGRRKRLTETMKSYAKTRIGNVQIKNFDCALQEARLCAKENDRSFPSVWKSKDGNHYIVVKLADREFAQDLDYEEVLSYYQMIDEKNKI